MKKMRITTLVMCLIILSAPCIFSAEEKGKEAEKPAPVKEMTEGELAKRINDNLDNLPEILSFLPGVKKETDEAGGASYSYNGKRIKDLSKEELSKLSSRVSNEAVRARTDRINRQLNATRRAEQVARQGRQMVPHRPPARIPRAPVTYPATWRTLTGSRPDFNSGRDKPQKLPKPLPKAPEK